MSRRAPYRRLRNRGSRAREARLFIPSCTHFWLAPPGRLRQNAGEVKMKAIGLALILAVLPGCAPSAPSGAKSSAPARKPDKRAIVEPSLQGILRIVDVRSGVGPGGLLEFQVNVQNLLPKAKTIFYRTEWLDQDGALLDLPEPELSWTLLRQEYATLSRTAPAPVARDFRLKFRARGN